MKPMLAKAQDSFQEVLKRMQGLHFTMEYKYDGERAQVRPSVRACVGKEEGSAACCLLACLLAFSLIPIATTTTSTTQIHKLPSGEIKIFSRNSEDTTGKYPDVVSALPQAIKEGTTSFVIDAEVRGEGRRKGCIHLRACVCPWCCTAT